MVGYIVGDGGPLDLELVVFRDQALIDYEATWLPAWRACVDIATRASLKEMVAPGVMAVIVPIMVGIFMGPEALAGVLTGSIVSGSTMAIMMANAGGAWDNCKKYVEAGAHGGVSGSVGEGARRVRGGTRPRTPRQNARATSPARDHGRSGIGCRSGCRLG